MGTHEEDLKTTISQGRWEAPHVGQLGDAVDTLNRAMSLLAESPGWGGKAAQAASETWVSLQRSFAKVADAAAEVERVNTNAGAALDRAAAAIGELPAGKVPSWIHNTVNAAEAGSMVFIPAMGVSVLASSAVSVFESFLGNQREAKATEARSVLEQELNDCSAQLKAIPWNDVAWTAPEPQPTPTPDPVPDPIIRVGGGGGGGGYTPSPNPSYDVPAYPGGGSSTLGGGSSAPGGGSSASGIGGSFPSSPTYHSPSIDDGSVGTLPGLSRGAGGGFGAGGMGGAGNYGGGANSGLTAGVLGGATAAGAAALRFGTGAGFGGGGMGGGGLAGGVSGTGGLLGAGGSGGAGGSAGAGSSAGGAGAAGGSRGGMMGGQPMGGGAGAGKKDKRPGLGGLMAPKIEDDEPEFIPLPDGARAGGRNTNPGGSTSL